MVSFSLAVVFVVAGKGICPKHSHYKEVEGCEIRCDRLLAPIMPLDCLQTKKHRDCRCEDGLLPQSGTYGLTVLCVSPQECQTNCSANAHYEPFGSPCQATCDQPKVTEPCEFPGGPTCVCNFGYVMDQNQLYKCVKPNECSSAHKP
ncbi:IgGFc-binding protein-like isoform X2 [Rana temporaria]|uniref:IgGFc-binding protein-like isoform X2 n=1 Tax=Rana temporaria TaxID=8407 RepID=UPI001AAD8051|nr:IgGFc-binding protein-like isoform X2 [Rana temporaria]